MDAVSINTAMCQDENMVLYLCLIVTIRQLACLKNPDPLSLSL